ncbi:IS110 family transposase [Cupriavidus consociatus]|uniref:IS110 family transposase n=1 Tax=Cupriavidus consociatus TaxID=2821357 RepID=UPI001AE25C99|nr:MULTISPECIES: IS110 family transposase [unclassified Cupriavidus]MBP0623389.1 IS110 family transposase [Cupriavidus sp. LEh25]MDK2660086.1 IS110 family transposase [Cupriavidus sp. LEh21]
MPIVTVGIDLAKNIFAIHGVDEAGKAALTKPRVSRDQLAALIAKLSPCVIGMEACSGAHHWARVFQQHGHTVKLMAPKHVAPYRMSGKRGKNDAADAAAICEAVTRPSMRFVPLKDEHQQATLCLHRTRQGFVEERTAAYNRMRGLLAEFGVVLPQSPERLRREITPHLDALPGWTRRCISDLLDHTGNLEDRIAEYDRAIREIAHTDERSKRLTQLRGIGPTTASALLATLGAGHDFRNGRQVAAWLGLTPGQYSSGGKSRLGSITKAGDAYLRGLLVIGARAVIANLSEKQDRFSRWVRSLVERRGYWRAAVAIAAKNARMAWAILKYGDPFKYEPVALGSP